MTLDDLIDSLFRHSASSRPQEPPPGEITRRALANEFPGPSPAPIASDPHKAAGLPTPPAVRPTLTIPRADSQRVADGQTGATGSVPPPAAPGRPAPNLSLPDTSPNFTDKLGGVFASLSGPAALATYNKGVASRRSRDMSRLAANKTYQAFIAKGEDPSTAEAATYNPELAQQLIKKHWGGGEGKSRFGIIGKDALGSPQYGWINERTKELDPVERPGDSKVAAAVASGTTGEEFLKTIPAQKAALVKAMVEGRMQYPTGFALRSPMMLELIQLASQYEPGFDATVFKTRSEGRSRFATGKQGEEVKAHNMVMNHLTDLYDTVDRLGNWNVPFLNYIRNKIREQDPSNPEFQTAIKEWNLNAQAVATEMMKAFRGGGVGSVQEVEDWKSSLDSASTPAQMRAVIRRGVTMLEGRLDPLANQYNSTMGSRLGNLYGTDLLNPKARRAVSKIRGEKATRGRGEAQKAFDEFMGYADVGGDDMPAGATADPLARARDAIARGADRNAVIQRLRENGVDPGGL